MKKVLVCTTLDITVKSFLVPHLKLLKDLGYEVHVASNGNEKFEYCDKKFDIPFERSPLKVGNIKAYKEMKGIIDNNEYSIIHCHTPVGGALCRLAARDARNKGTKVIYTAHGFHFCKGAPLLNWMIYYPIEILLANITDVLITINKEDYERAKKFKAKKVVYVPGVGLDTQKYANIVVDKKAKRKELGVPKDAFFILSVGELNDNKNHIVILKAISKIKNNSNIFYGICGEGKNKECLLNEAKKLGLYDRFKLFGQRNDIGEILKAADLFAFPSKREGLGLSALEAMACGLPIVTSNVHGIVDYAINGKSAIINKPLDTEGFANAIKILMQNDKLRSQMGQNNLVYVGRFNKKNVIRTIEDIYSST